MALKPLAKWLVEENRSFFSASRASVTVDGGSIAEIGSAAAVVLLGVTHDDRPEHADRLAEKVRALRIFEDEDGPMNEPLGGARGPCVSQFTLLGGRARATGLRSWPRP